MISSASGGLEGGLVAIAVSLEGGVEGGEGGFSSTGEGDLEGGASRGCFFLD